MLEDKSKITTQMRKGVLEYAILMVIWRWEAYASDILSSLKEHSLIVVEGTLYPLLTRMKDDGLISYYWVESQSGPPRKYYRLTDVWRDTLILMDHAWSELSKAVDGIRENKNS